MSGAQAARAHQALLGPGGCSSLVGVLRLAASRSKGTNIFLSPGNLRDVLRQVSITGIVAIGMTLVILTGGIDLSVGSLLAFGSVICAMLLTQPGWTAGAVMGVPGMPVVVFAAVFALVRFVGHRARERRAGAGRAPARSGRSDPWLDRVAAGRASGWPWRWRSPCGRSARCRASSACWACCSWRLASAFWWARSTGRSSSTGGLQPFIVTLAMMVGALGVARLTAGPGQRRAAGLHRRERGRRLRRAAQRCSTATSRCRACSSWAPWGCSCSC